MSHWPEMGHEVSEEVRCEPSVHIPPGATLFQSVILGLCDSASQPVSGHRPCRRW